MRTIMFLLLVALPAQADTLLVGNKSANTLWALDTASGARLAEFATGAGPHAVAVAPDGTLAVVANYGARAPEFKVNELLGDYCLSCTSWKSCAHRA